MHSHLKGTANVSFGSTQHRLPRPLHDENGVLWPVPVKLMSARFAFGMEERKHYCDTWQMSPSSWRKYVTHGSEITTAATKYNSRRFHKYILYMHHLFNRLWRNGFPRPSRSGAHLYSQKVSSFISCDSTSGWRSSFSFTADEVQEIFFWMFCFFATWWKLPPNDPKGAWADCRQRGLIVWRGLKRRRSHATGGRPCEKEMFAVWNKDICMCRFLIGSPLCVMKGMEEDKGGHAGNGDWLRAAEVYGHCRRQRASLSNVHRQGQSWGPPHISQLSASQSKSCRNIGTSERFISLESWLRCKEPSAGQIPTDLFPWRTFPVAGAAAAYLHTCRLCSSAGGRPWAQWGRAAPRHTWSRWSSSAWKSRFADFPHLGRREETRALNHRASTCWNA